LQASRNASKRYLFQQHALDRGFGVITQASPLRILHKLPLRRSSIFPKGVITVTAFVILIAMASRAVFIDVVGATVGALQQRFDHRSRRKSDLPL
jgi:energy-converting hydrogenase Eha subunit A